MNEVKVQKLIARWAIISSLLFVVLTGAAMLLYPGGTWIDPGTSGYSFTGNFFSDLGRTVDFNETPVLPAGWLMFSLAMLITGTALASFFAMLWGLCRHDGFRRHSAMGGSVAGVLCGIAFAGVGLTPWNLVMDLHMNFVYGAFTMFTLACVCYLPVLVADRRWARYNVVTMAVFVIFLVIYLGLLFGGPSAKEPAGLLVHVVGQKVIAYSSVLALALLALGALGVLKKQEAR